VFDREAKWVREVLTKIVDMVPTLRVVMEHITTKEGVEFVTNAREGLLPARFSFHF